MPNAYFENPNTGRLTLRVNPYSCKWEYDLRTNEMETYGGKVIQLLGVEFIDMIIEGETGRGRFAELERMAYYVRDTMGFGGPDDKKYTHFIYPDMGWDIVGWFVSFPSYFVDVPTTSPMWRVNFHIEWDNGELARSVIKKEFENVKTGIGNFYDPTNADSVYRLPTPESLDPTTTKDAALFKSVLSQGNEAWTGDFNQQYAQAAEQVNQATQQYQQNLAQQAQNNPTMNALANTPVSNYGGQ